MVERDMYTYPMPPSVTVTDETIPRVRRMDERRTSMANGSWIVGAVETSRAVPVGLFELPVARQKSSANGGETFPEVDHRGWAQLQSYAIWGDGLSRMLYLENK